jgi:AcrR family transcriptional regulator
MPVLPIEPKKKRDIKVTAKRLFDEYGFNHISMSDIGHVANVSKGTLYKYFRSKRHLYESVLRDMQEAEIARVKAILDQDVGFAFKLQEIIAVRVARYRETRQHFFDDDVVYTPQMTEQLESFQQTKRQLRKTLYALGRKEGYIDPNLSDETLELYFDSIELGLSHRFHDVSRIPTHQLNGFFQMVYAGLIQPYRPR